MTGYGGAGELARTTVGNDRTENTNGAEAPVYDSVDRPRHYNTHPSGVECITVTEHMNFCRGNAMKYLWRAGEKGSELEDLRKARWYLDREIARLERSTAPAMGPMGPVLGDSRCGEPGPTGLCCSVRGHAGPHDFRGVR